MVAQQVQPLRIQKGAQIGSPTKPPHRPLSELSPMGIRRNSPSFPGNKGNIFKGDSSPFDSPPYNVNSADSPRLFWQGRDPTSPFRETSENRSPFGNENSPVSSKRSSIENLKKASRVKNSSMFAREQKNEYDPSQPTLLERPLAGGRPLSMQIQGNAYGGRGVEAMRGEVVCVSTVDVPAEHEMPAEQEASDQHATEQPTSTLSQCAVAPLSPSKYNTSPTKSSLSRKTGMNAAQSVSDPENHICSDEDDSVVERKLPEGRVLHRHAKSVTFDQAPPQINEYEMTTPDPSSVASGSREGSYESFDDEEEVSFDCGSSLDREDSFDASLEDTDKTPVVLPEDWRFMSPDQANTELAKHEEDPFDGEYDSPAPTAQPGVMEYRPHQASVASTDSNGQTRPLPPLPALNKPKYEQLETGNSPAATIERISSAQRSLPSPPKPASISKTEIRRMSGGSLTLDDRLRLMMLQEQENGKSETEKQRQRRMRRAGSKERTPIHENSEEGPGPALQDDIRTLHVHPTDSPRITRDSILRSLASNQDLNSEYSDEEAPSPAYCRLLELPDPDLPIPSLEDPTQVVVEEVYEELVLIKEEPPEDQDLYSIPNLPDYQVHESSDSDDDEASQYSQPSVLAPPSLIAEEGQDTPRAQSPAREPEKKPQPNHHMALPDFANFGIQESFDLGLKSYTTPSPPLTEKVLEQAPAEDDKVPKKVEKEVERKDLPDLASLRAAMQRPTTPVETLQPPQFSALGDDSDVEPGTPDSVIRHPVPDSPSPSPAPSSTPEIAELEATIKAPSGQLKTRPSLTPADLETMAATRRRVSEQLQPQPLILEPEHGETSQSQEILPETKASSHEKYPAESDKNQLLRISQPSDKRISSLVKLEIPGGDSHGGLGLGLEEEFDRVVQAQKVAFELSLSELHRPFHGPFPPTDYPAPKHNSVIENAPLLKPQGARALPFTAGHIANRSPGRQRGYLMRQNTKVVVATSRHVEDDSWLEPAPAAHEPLMVTTSPRKISQQTWVAEPWNGKSRRKSIRASGELNPRKKALEGPAPPLPGQASNVQDGLDAVNEEELAEEEAEDFEDGTERGRLFVKVVGVKELDLPLPQEQRTQFALTLDNGLHCVTTAWLDLRKSAPIGQEFELVVLNDLEFQLTLQMKLEEPKVQRPVSPTKAPASPTKKQGTFGRLFGSPKKRKELELRAQQEAEAEAAAREAAKRPQSAYEMVQGVVAKDGSFARAYVSLSEHEKQAYGRPYSVDIMCFNEWAMEEVTVGSSRSKKSVVTLQRRPPYPIGKLELQLLYVPKPKGAKDEDMPKSMNSAVRELREAETKTDVVFEGYLSQQGGDCPYWRRRFFKLNNSRLTAYHETTHQPRATINLAKASKLIDDKSTLTQKETSTKGGGRRKSAFAEEEEGYMFVEEGFRMRFANGEVIDFYADSAAEKDEWMKVLSEVVGKGISSSSNQSKKWAGMVLKREKSVLARDRKARDHANAWGAARQTQGPPPTESPGKSSSRETTKEQMEQRGAGQERQARAEAEAEAEARATERQAQAGQRQAQIHAGAERGLGKPVGLGISHKQPHLPTPQPGRGHFSHATLPQLVPRHQQPRPGHSRTESYQPHSGSRSQSSSPIKTTMEERRKKARSMMDAFDFGRR